MPINTKDNIKYLYFGYGDIFVGEIEDNSGLTYGAAFIQSEPREIGSEWVEVRGTTIDQHDTHVVMQFDRVASIDVVIETLQEIKLKMLKQGGEK